MKLMKNLWKLTLLAGWMAVTFGCSDSGEEVSVPDNDWTVSVSRAVTDGQSITVALRYGNTTSMGTLQPADTDGGTGTWVGEMPVWPTDNTTPVEAIALSPVVDALPVTVSAADGTAWLMDYQPCTGNTKPTSFEMTHLMAQLEVHIKLHDDAMHHYQPTDAVISLYTAATVDYSQKRLTEPATMNEAFSLGTFSKEGDANTATDENWVNTTQVVIPQTLAAGEPCLTFKAGEEIYTFIPEEDITLNPGKKTKLYLGVAYENASVTLTQEGVVITPWEDGETYNENVFTPDN